MNIVSITGNSRSGRGGLRNNCLACRAAPVCSPAQAESASCATALLTQRIRVARDTPLFTPGTPAEDRFYAVHYGTFKYFLSNAAEQRKIVDFMMSGDLLGLDALAHGQQRGSAIALEDSEVCAIRRDDLARQPLLLHRIFSKLIAREQMMAQLLRNSSATQRLASFLLDLSWRYQRRGYASQHFRLLMPRQDIANFLAITPECLSRELAHLRNAGLLQVDGRDVTLCDTDALRQLAGNLRPPPSAPLLHLP